MKLAVLGIITAILGLAVDVSGLILVGCIWIPLGLIARAVLIRTQERSPAASDYLGPGDPSRPRPRLAPAVVAVQLMVAVPSLAIGVLGIGFEGAEGWRWIPLAVGALSGALALIGALVLITGGGTAQAELGDAGDAAAPEEDAEAP